jgi:hypothetical protein
MAYHFYALQVATMPGGPAVSNDGDVDDGPEEVDLSSCDGTMFTLVNERVAEAVMPSSVKMCLQLILVDYTTIAAHVFLRDRYYSQVEFWLSGRCWLRVNAGKGRCHKIDVLKYLAARKPSIGTPGELESKACTHFWVPVFLCLFSSVVLSLLFVLLYIWFNYVLILTPK